jgi:NAD+ diphosphatase
VIRAGFTGSPLDRADSMRHDADALAAAIVDPAARLLPLPDFEPVMAPGGRLAWTALSDAPAGAELVLLGLDDGAPRFAALVDGARPPRGRSPALGAALDTLLPEEAATYAIARSVLDWHARHRFCANCGHATQVVRAGWVRHCPHCGAEHFPRTDPVVIMIAEHDGRALVGRQASWDAGRYSALAGFVEPGESVEEAVARELMEEAGVRVGPVRYVASQPWPFPSQLMIACVAEALDDRLTVDRRELEDAMWVSRDEVRVALAGGVGRFAAPPSYAIAHTLLATWAASA